MNLGRWDKNSSIQSGFSNFFAGRRKFHRWCFQSVNEFGTCLKKFLIRDHSSGPHPIGERQSMVRFLVVASAVMAGIVLTPQARAAQTLEPAGLFSGHKSMPIARAAARGLRPHGYWGFGKARSAGGHLYLQAYRGRGIPVMVKIALDSGRIVAVKTFRQRHVRSGVALADIRFDFPASRA